MRNVKIITDSCADLSAQQLAAYDIDYAKMTTVEDGKEAPALLTWTPDEVHRFYDTIRGGKRITTAQVSVEEFNRVFGQYLDAGCDIVYIACSSKQSGSVNTGFVTAKKLLEAYPGAEIYCIDSLNASIGEGMLAIEAAELAKQGKSAKEIYDQIMAMRKNVQQYVTVHTLEHLKKAGRVTASSAFFGNLIGVKPILISDVNGTQTPIKKVKGRKNSLQELVNQLRDNIIAPETQTVYLAHADCQPEEVEALKEMIRAAIPCKDISVGYIGPIIGASIGPDAFGIWAFGKAVTYAAEEK